MKVLAADGYIPCRGLVRTLQLLQDDVCVTAADSIDEVLARIPDLLISTLCCSNSSMPGMENFTGLRRTVEKLPDVPVVVTSPKVLPKSSPPFAMLRGAISLFRRRRLCSNMLWRSSCWGRSTSRPMSWVGAITSMQQSSSICIAQL